MFSKELKKLVKLSGGKIILSEGRVDESYVVMDLKHYLKERESVDFGGIEFEDDDCFDEDCCDDDFNDITFETEESGGEKNGFSKNHFEDTRGDHKLTKDELLDRINADIESLRTEKAEDEIVNDFEFEKKDSEGIRYEKVD